MKATFKFKETRSGAPTLMRVTLENGYRVIWTPHRTFLEFPGPFSLDGTWFKYTTAGEPLDEFIKYAGSVAEHARTDCKIEADLKHRGWRRHSRKGKIVIYTDGRLPVAQPAMEKAWEDLFDSDWRKSAEILRKGTVHQDPEVPAVSQTEASQQNTQRMSRPHAV